MDETYDSKILLIEHHVGKPKLEPNKSATQTNRYSPKSTILFPGALSQWMNVFHLKQSAGLTQFYCSQNFRQYLSTMLQNPMLMKFLPNKLLPPHRGLPCTVWDCGLPHNGTIIVIFKLRIQRNPS